VDLRGESSALLRRRVAYQAAERGRNWRLVRGFVNRFYEGLPVAAAEAAYYGWQNRMAVGRAAERGLRYLTGSTRRRVSQNNMVYGSAPRRRVIGSRPYGSRKTPYPKMTPCRPKVKVSKKFKAKVHAVESAKVAKGTYTIRTMGNILTNYTQNSQQPSAELVHGNGAGLTSTSSGNPAILNSFNWFTEGDVLDAASVLFNGKVSDPARPTSGNFDNEKLVLEIPYMSVTMSLTNSSMTDQEVDFYMCISKSSINDASLSTWQSAISNAAENVNGQLTTHYGAEPGQLADFSKKWTYKKKTFYLKPGESKKFFVKQGPLCYNYQKFLNTSSNFNFPKGVGVSCFLVHKQPKLLPNVNGISAHHATTYTVGNYSWLSCEITRKYVIEAPELAAESQKFDKYVSNSYTASTNTVVQTQVGSSGDTVKTVFVKAPQVGPTTIIE